MNDARYVRIFRKGDWVLLQGEDENIEGFSLVSKVGLPEGTYYGSRAIEVEWWDGYNKLYPMSQEWTGEIEGGGDYDVLKGKERLMMKALMTIIGEVRRWDSIMEMIEIMEEMIGGEKTPIAPQEEKRRIRVRRR